MTGQVILRRYKVLRQLDEGGMCDIFLGMQLEQPREVAIKVLKSNLAGQPKVREHFRREIYILSRYSHPNVVAYFDADANGSPPCLVMEYLRGVDLLRLLERSKRLTPERAGRLLGQMCSVLHEAHENGIVHRDVKPGNFFVVHPGTGVEKIKLMDFGLAKMSSMLYISPEEMVNLRQPTASGTPEYISPEQVRGNDVDRRSDVYSLGIVLYEMLAGRRPFEGSDVKRLLLAHQDQSPPPFASIGLSGVVPARIEAVVMSCLEKYPENRPATAEAVAQAFEAALGRKIYQKAAQAAAANTVQRPANHSTRPTGDRLQTMTAGMNAIDRNAIISHVTANMIESMAMLKLKGFIGDLGGKIAESVPGMIRVRLGDAVAATKSGGLFGWFGGGAKTAAEDPIDMELSMEKRDPSQSSQLTITLKLTTPRGLFTASARSRCEKIGRDLQAYLMGR